MLLLSGCSGRCRTLRTAASLWREGMAVFNQNDPATAEAMQRQALDLVRGIGGFDVLQARIHNNIGVILSCSGRQTEANNEFATALDLLHGRVAQDTCLHRTISKNYRTTLGPQHVEALPMNAFAAR
jgi:hypothetical protein